MFLFVEDDGKVMARALGLLARLGIRGSKIFDTAPGALEYLASVRIGLNPKPEAIIIDLNLRIGSGMDVLAEVSKNPDLSDIPVFIWTQSTSDLQRDICLHFGAREVLAKSKSTKELKAAISRLRGTH